ncbi:MAG: hypothetical protein K6G43_10585 [Lachnospiraceae bacterium]|nr:hypothetical protein [Lachnospiraceae bacterium]
MQDLTPDNSTVTFRETTPVNRIRRFAWILAAASVIIGGIIIWAGISSGARSALNTARDIRVAMKLVSLEYYGNGTSIYDPSSPNGLAEGAMERIMSLSPVKGELILAAWDEENNIPLSYTYREGRYLVEYKEIGHGDGSYGMNGDWNVYYNVRIMEYKAES